MNKSRIFEDQMHRQIAVNHPPKKIISLVPSQTELLFYLGLENEIVGLTKFCIHPGDKIVNKAKVGGTKNLKYDKIRSLNPDLIIANKEENDKEQIELLSKEYPVWVSDVANLEDALDMIQKIGSMVGKENEARSLCNSISTGFQEELDGFISRPNISTAYLIWKKPYMVAGRDTFLNEMLCKVGLKNVFDNQFRYPEINREDLKKKNPKVILLSSEPFPFKEKHIAEFHDICPLSVIKLVDGELFSWYGSRLLQAPGYFAKLRLEIEKNL